MKNLKLFLLIALLFSCQKLSSSCNFVSFTHVHYYISGVMCHKMDSSPYAYTKLQINGQTIITDQYGRYWYEYKWEDDGTVIPKNIVFNFEKKDIFLKNDFKKYYFNSIKKGKLPIVYFDLYF